MRQESVSTALPASTWPDPASPSQEWVLLGIQRDGNIGATEGAKAERREQSEHKWEGLPGEGQGQGELSGT